jgi:hypothetical protein
MAGRRLSLSSFYRDEVLECDAIGPKFIRVSESIRSNPAQSGIPFSVSSVLEEKVRPIIREISVSRSHSLSARAHYIRLWYAYEMHRPENNGLLDGEAAPTTMSIINGLLLGLNYDVSGDVEFGGSGLRYRLAKTSGKFGESHPGQVLSALAECNVPLTQAITTSDGTFLVSDLVEECAKSFSFDEDIEWRAIALAIYRPLPVPWTTTDGQVVSFDRITSELLRRSRARGAQASCWGTHALYALAVFRSVDGVCPIWQDHSMRSQVDAALTQVAARLASAQRTDGSWDEHWDLPGVNRTVLSVENRLLITGHHLEWLSLVPEALRPPNTALQQAGEFVVWRVEQYSQNDKIQNICACSHGLRALALGARRSKLDIARGPAITLSNVLAEASMHHARPP